MRPPRSCSAGAARGAGSCARACRAFERSPDPRPAPSPPRSRALLLALVVCDPCGRMERAPCGLACSLLLGASMRPRGSGRVLPREHTRARSAPHEPAPVALLVLLLPLGSAALGFGRFPRAALDTSAPSAILGADRAGHAPRTPHHHHEPEHTHESTHHHEPEHARTGASLARATTSPPADAGRALPFRRARAGQDRRAHAKMADLPMWQSSLPIWQFRSRNARAPNGTARRDLCSGLGLGRGTRSRTRKENRKRTCSRTRERYTTTMQHERATLYVGLHSPVDPLDEGARAVLVRDRAERVRAIIGQAYECATVALVGGMWRGEGEPTLRIEHIGEADERERERARAIAREIKAELHQEAVGLTFEPVAFELI